MAHTTSIPAEAAQRFDALSRLIGNTPLLAIDFLFNGEPRTIYAKAEHMNLTGSVKDRMALYVLLHAYLGGAIEPAATIVEATSGNTGISFAAVGAALGHPVVVFMPDWMSSERKQLISSFGARTFFVSKEDGGFLGSIRAAESFAANAPPSFLPRQFSNGLNPEAHERTTGPEILAQLGLAGVLPDAFAAGVGTGGTVMGVGRSLRRRAPGVRIHPIEPAESPTLSTGCKVGTHRIQGISDEFIPPVVSLDELDDVIAVHDGDAIHMARKLSRELGLGVGISSGANLAGALIAQNRLGPQAIVATIFPDSNKKYLSTDLLREDEPVAPGYLSPFVRFTGFTVLPRVCSACVDLPLYFSAPLEP